MSRRLYLGRLPHDTRPEDITKHFDGYGRVVDCRVMTGFGFVEFESNKDAEDVVHAFNGKSFMGQSIIVEFAKDARRRDPDPSRMPPPRSRRPPGFRVVVTGISRDTSWQDLKDFGREAGSVTFADVDRDGTGILEYPTQDDAEMAIKHLDGRELRGIAVRMKLDESRGSGGRDRDRSPPRRERRDDRDYRDYKDDRDRDRDRRRSRSPPRRMEESRRYDDRREERPRDRDYRRDDTERERDRDHRREDREERDREPRREDREDRDRSDSGWESRR